MEVTDFNLTNVALIFFSLKILLREDEAENLTVK